jgi:hypothetical protein
MTMTALKMTTLSSVFVHLPTLLKPIETQPTAIYRTTQGLSRKNGRIEKKKEEKKKRTKG